MIGRDGSDTALRDHKWLMAEALDGLSQVDMPITFVIEVSTRKIVHLEGPCEKFFGKTAAEMMVILDPWETILAPSDASLAAKLSLDMELHGTVSRVLHVTLLDGKRRVLRLVAARREILGRVFSAGRVFDLGEAERLGLDQDVFRMAVEHTHDGVAVTDAKGDFLFINREHVTMFGYDRPEELVGKSWRSLYAEEEISHIEQVVFPELMSAGVWRGRLKAKRRDGVLFYEALTLSLLPGGGLVCNCQDVTTQVDLAKRLEASDSMFRTLLNALPVAVVIKSTQGSNEFVNAETFRVLGKGANPHGGTQAEEAEPSPDATFEILAKIDREVPEVVEDLQFSFPLVSGDGSRILAVKKLPLRIGSEAITHVCTLLEDVTERKRQKELAEENARQKEEYHSKQREFTSMVSHEFRTPLTSIEGVRYLLLKKSELLPKERADEHQRLLALQERAVGTLADLVDQVLRLNRIEHMTLALLPRAVNLAEFMQKALGNIGDAVSQKRVQLEMEVSEEFSAMFDEAQLRVVLDNLVSNALKYSPVGSKVTVRVAVSEQRWELSVADRGRGIPKADQAKLFQPFTRASNVGQVAGTGLGLTIIRRVVIFHQGTVSFTSEEGSGTTFTLTFPRQLIPHDEKSDIIGGAPTKINLIPSAFLP
jgi:PAS domain S-box-containing protein